MSQDKWTSLETELRKVRPARPPEAFVQRLQEAVQGGSTSSPCAASTGSHTRLGAWWRSWFKVLVPLGGAVVLLALIVGGLRLSPPSSEPELSDAPPIDEVELDRHLVAAFEGVAELPGSPPVRFRFYGWQQAVTLRNAEGSIEVEAPEPRLEIVPVGFEVY